VAGRYTRIKSVVLDIQQGSGGRADDGEGESGRRFELGGGKSLSLLLGHEIEKEQGKEKGG